MKLHAMLPMLATAAALNGESYCEGDSMRTNEADCKANEPSEANAWMGCCHWNDWEDPASAKCWSSVGREKVALNGTLCAVTGEGIEEEPTGSGGGPPMPECVAPVLACFGDKNVSMSDLAPDAMEPEGPTDLVNKMCDLHSMVKPCWDEITVAAVTCVTTDAVPGRPGEVSRNLSAGATKLALKCAPAICPAESAAQIRTIFSTVDHLQSVVTRAANGSDGSDDHDHDDGDDFESEGDKVVKETTEKCLGGFVGDFKTCGGGRLANKGKLMEVMKGKGGGKFGVDTFCALIEYLGPCSMLIQNATRTCATKVAVAVGYDISAGDPATVVDCLFNSIDDICPGGGNATATARRAATARAVTNHVRRVVAFAQRGNAWPVASVALAAAGVAAVAAAAVVVRARKQEPQQAEEVATYGTV